MKKLLLSIGLLASSFMNAQENWINIDNTGFSHHAMFRFSEVFQNKLYIAADTNMAVPLLYSSLNGDTGSYVEETAFSGVIQSVNEIGLSSSTKDNNYLFLGTTAYFDTLADFAVPQVYRYDGTNYVKHGTINFGFPNVYNGSYSCIDKMALYSPTGSNDTIYAFSYIGAQNTISVWKAPANMTNPTWVNSTNFTGTGISKVYDTRVWHKKLYITVANGMNGGMILRTSNGVDWDTVLTALSLQSHLGSFYYDVKFASLEVFRDTLITAVSSNYTHDQALWYTADSLAPTQNWNSFIDTVNYAGITNNWYGVSDMQVGDGKLWIQINYSNQYPAVFICMKNSFGRDTLLRSSGGTSLEGVNNIANDYRLSYFNNAIYTTGHTGMASKIGPQDNNNNERHLGSTILNSGTDHGNIYRFTTINPVASFVDSVITGSGYCQFNTIYLASTSSNATTCDWYINGSFYASGLNVTFNPNGGGVNNIEMIAYNGTNQSIYKDSAFSTITIYWNPVIDSVRASSDTVCQGQVDSMKTFVSGGTRPYTYSWYNAQDFITYPGDSVSLITLYVCPTPSPYVYMAVTVKDAHMCPASGPNTLFIDVNPADSLSGIINDTLLNPVSAGKVFLFKLNPLNPNPGDTAAVFNLSPGGYYDFPGLYYGSYIAKAVADTSNPLYKTAVGTYYSNKTYPFQWDSALVIQHHGCTNGNNSGNNIKILQMPAPVLGTGTIDGVITEGPGFNTRLNGGGFSPLGAPLKGVDVKLGKNPGGSPAARTTTDTVTGHFTFHNVPTGSYKIYVDIPNYGMDSVRSVVISGATNSVHNDYYVDSNMVRVVPTAMVSKTICSNDSILLQGAYQTTAGVYYDTLQNQGHDSMVVTSLSVNPAPTLTVATSNDTICNGGSAVLNAAGSSTSYLWSANAGSVTTTTVSVSPTTTTIYTVTGTLGTCPLSKTITVVVKSCVGIQNYNQQGLVMYPNPASDKLFVQSQKNGYLKLMNITGQIVLEQTLTVGDNEINLSSLPSGAYQVSINCSGQITNTKVMVSK